METKEQLLITKIKDRIKTFEGYSAVPYVCPAGKWTIGYGFNYQDNPLPANLPTDLLTSLFRDGFSIELAEYLLEREVSACLHSAQTFKWFFSLKAPRQAVVVDMIYQLGLGGFMNFRKTIAALAAGSYALAGAEMKDSKWYRQSGRRSKVNIRQMITGNWIDIK